jgi:hypothetical protein
MVFLDPRCCAFSLFFLFLVTKFTAANTTLTPIMLPAPPVPYLTALKIQVMVDTSRPDPYNSNERYRRLLTSVFTPVPKSESSELCYAQYMPPATAAAQDQALIGGQQPLFEPAQLSGLYCGASSPVTHLPLLVWSPGYTESRLQFSILAQYVASYGYEVIFVDHSGDAKITEFPNGEIVLGVFPSNATTNVILQDRVFALPAATQDMLFAIDSYSKSTCGASRVYGSDRKVSIIAHEGIAAQAILNDFLKGDSGRIAGGVNLDGMIYGRVLTDGIGAGKKSHLLWKPASGPPNVTNWNQ